MTVLVMKDQKTKAMVSHLVMCKGRGLDDVVEEAVESIERF